MKQALFAVCIGLALCALTLHGLDALFLRDNPADSPMRLSGEHPAHYQINFRTIHHENHRFLL